MKRIILFVIFIFNFVSSCVDNEPVLENCRKYYKCDQNGSKREFQCPSNLYYNCLSKKCENSFSPACCKNDPIITEHANKILTEDCKINNVTIKSPYSCGRYYICINHKYVMKQCEGNKEFDNILGRCTDKNCGNSQMIVTGPKEIILVPMQSDGFDNEDGNDFENGDSNGSFENEDGNDNGWIPIDGNSVWESGENTEMVESYAVSESTETSSTSTSTSVSSTRSSTEGTSSSSTGGSSGPTEGTTNSSTGDTRAESESGTTNTTSSSDASTSTTEETTTSGESTSGKTTSEDLTTSDETTSDDTTTSSEETTTSSEKTTASSNDTTTSSDDTTTSSDDTTTSLEETTSSDETTTSSGESSSDASETTTNSTTIPTTPAPDLIDQFESFMNLIISKLKYVTNLLDTITSGVNILTDVVGYKEIEDLPIPNSTDVTTVTTEEQTIGYPTAEDDDDDDDISIDGTFRDSTAHNIYTTYLNGDSNKSKETSEIVVKKAKNIVILVN